MQKPMEGVRILEVAQYTFVPAASAVLADWGADVIKVEPAETGDAQRGIVNLLGLAVVSKGSNFFPIAEGPNRGKRSIGLNLASPEARDLLDELIKISDVFLTNYLPAARKKFRLSLEDVRAVNPDIIYARGSGFGQRGPEADKGGYDSTAFWARGGSGAGVTPPDSDFLLGMPAGAYGDNTSGMTLAGGISAALFARERSGEPSVVDVSLLSVGAWATSFSGNLALVHGGPLPVVSPPKFGSATNPLSGSYRTSDGRYIMLTMLQPGLYWPEFCTVVGRPELASDERFSDAKQIMANAAAGCEIVAEIMRSRTLEEWIKAFEGMKGQWSVVQNAWEVANDASLVANGYVGDVTDVDGKAQKLIANPVQFDETPAELSRAPQFAEHTDDIIRELGHDDERLIELKIAGAIT
jgi:crotonobetainyl-CoA:carnitine CoA-transferase CaiB-like acyl-CoA transferase